MEMYLIYGTAFFIGGSSYCAIELLTRARTHYSMFFCGGLAILILFAIYYNNRSINPLLFSVIASIIITALELIFGIIFNLYLKMDVWDYSNMPFNLLGQICLPFSLLWMLAGLGLYIVFRLIKI